MRANPIQLIGGFYADETRPWSQQDICNWLPVAAESDGTRTPTMAKTPPGLSPFARISGDSVRGIYNAEGRLFTVMGNTLYQITPTAAIELGDISGSGRVRFAHNQITGGNQVLIVNGSAGWVWNTVTSTLTLITDTGYPGAIDAVFIDGYLVQIEPARRYAFHSDLADALAYNTLDRFTSEVSPDLLVGMAVSNNELLLLSQSTGEFFENTGASQQPFRSKRISFNRGCAGRYTIATMDNTVYWLGDDGSFYLLDGYTPKRISTRPIEQAIRGLNWAQAFAFTWEDSGHSVCYWTLPDGMTFGYDAAQQKWHRRASYGFDRWRVNCMAEWQGYWVAGDFQSGRLWKLDWSYPLEYDQEFVSEITSTVIHDNQSLVLMPRFEVIMDTGMPEVAVRAFEIDPPPPPFDSIYISLPGDTRLLYGTNEAQTAFTTVDAGGFTSSAEARVYAISGKLIAARQSGRTRISSDGLTFGAVTGLAQSGTIESIINTGPQLIAYPDTGTNCWVSSNGGANWSSQALGFTLTSGRVAQLGDSVLAFSSTANSIQLSTNDGASFASVSMGGSITNFGKSFPLATGSRFLVFGVNNSAPFQNVVKWSATGAAGTWTEVSLPGGQLDSSQIYQACLHEGSGRIVAVARTGAVYYSDDQGSTWSAGGSVLQNTFYSAGTNKMIYSPLNDRVYYLGFYSDGGSIDDYRLYSTSNATSWTLHYGSPSSDGGLNNIAAWELAT